MHDQEPLPFDGLDAVSGEEIDNSCQKCRDGEKYHQRSSRITIICVVIQKSNSVKCKVLPNYFIK